MGNGKTMVMIFYKTSNDNRNVNNFCAMLRIDASIRFRETRKQY